MYDRYQALIFDCDGTLVDSLYAHYTAWTEILTRYEVPFTVERMWQLGGVPTAETIAILAQEADLEVPVATVARAKEDRFLELIYDTVREVKPVVDIARRYHGKLPLGVATGSATQLACDMLTALQIDHLFGLYNRVTGSRGCQSLLCVRPVDWLGPNDDHGWRNLACASSRGAINRAPTLAPSRLRQLRF